MIVINFLQLIFKYLLKEKTLQIVMQKQDPARKLKAKKYNQQKVFVVKPFEVINQVLIDNLGLIHW